MSLIERIPPHDDEAEMAAVASCLANAQALTEVMATGLDPADCYQHRHQLLLEAMFTLARQGSPVELLTVRAYLADRKQLDNAGGYGYLVDLASAMPNVWNASLYAERIQDRAQRRATITALMNALPALFDAPEEEDPVGKAQAAVMGCQGKKAHAGAVDFGEAVEATLQPIYQAADGHEGASTARAFTTGLEGLDSLAWVEPGDYTILGARPSDGKTAMALQIMLHIASHGGRVLLHSLEMKRSQLAQRYLAMRSEVSLYAMRQGYVNAEGRGRLATAYGESLGMAFRVDDRSGVTVAQIASSLRRELLQGPVTLLVVDHLLKVRPADARATRHGQMSQISNDLFNLARDTKVAVLGLYQLNRGAAAENRTPRMSDLRESGSVEEDADNVWILHRPERTSFTPATLLVEKNRQGACGEVKMTFDSARTRFSDDKGLSAWTA